MSNEELALAIRSGERDKLHELWQQTERFVAMRARSVARNAGPSYGVTAEDLYQSGFLALVSAVETFTPDGGRKFIGWLDYYLRREFAEWGGWRTERQKQEPLNHAISLNSPLAADEEDEGTPEDLIADPASEFPYNDIEHEIWLGQLRSTLDEALGQLPALQRESIRRKYFDANSLMEIGAALGVSPERARQLAENGIRTLGNPPVSCSLEKFVDDHTPYYLHIGVETFRRSRTSATEQVVLIRERLAGIKKARERSESIWTQRLG